MELQTYEGGHGWRGNIFGDISKGIQWPEARQTTEAKDQMMERNRRERCQPTATKPTTTPSASASGWRGGIRNCGKALAAKVTDADERKMLEDDLTNLIWL